LKKGISKQALEYWPFEDKAAFEFYRDKLDALDEIN
jgi:hypothetical protein